MLELVTGGSGSGKSTYLRSDIIKSSVTGRIRSLSFILQPCILMGKRQKRRLRDIGCFVKEKGLRH